MIVGLGLGITAAGHFTVTAVAEVIRSKKGITAIGNAQVDTAQSKFGGASAYFDGSGDRLQIYNQQIYLSGNFTIEFWFRGGNQTGHLIGNSGDTNLVGNNRLSMFFVPGSNKLDLYMGPAPGISTNTTISTNTWYHIAIVRISNVAKIYVDGTEQTATKTHSLDIGNVYHDEWKLGTDRAGGDPYLGHIDEVRISNTARYTTTFTPSTTPFVNDENTLLLLHMDGTDASTVFEDDNGVRAKVGITAIGNAQVDTAQYKFGGASAVFDGTGDYLNLSTSSNLTMPVNNDFTIEGWIRPTGTTRIQVIATNRNGNLSGTTWDISMWSGSYIITRTATLLFETGAGAGSIVVISNNNVFTQNTWHHFSVVRTSNEITLYVDGVDVTNNRAGTRSAAIGTDGNLSIGLNPGDNVNTFIGHIDEFRWSNTARYTAAFTPSTTPFVNDANTLLLLHMDGTDAATVFEDDNGQPPFVARTAVTVTANGNAQVDTAQSKFGGASALFDGTDDFLSMPSFPAIGTGEFTAECWIYFTDTNGGVILDFDDGKSTGIHFYLRSDEKLGFYDGGAILDPATTTLSPSTWYHIAVTRQSDNYIRIYVNGTLDGTSASTYTTSIGGGFRIGEANTVDYLGHIDEVRISNTARYTANFTAPTTPFVNDANTLLLLHMDGTDASTTFTDDNISYRTKKGVTAIADAQIDTAQSKFGGASAVFDGSGDELIVGSSSDFAMGTGDWTIEFWVRTNITGNQDYFDYRPTTATQQIIYASGANLIYYQNGAGRITGTSALSSNTWHHIALARSGTSTKMFVDGTQVGSTWTDTVNYSGVGILEISNTALGAINGHMDELRWSKGIARYTANFTPSTTPFQNDSNTVLLLHMDGTDGSKVFTDDNGVPPDYDYGA